MKKSYQVLKWTAEVREKELQCLEEVELLDNHDPAVEFESDFKSPNGHNLVGDVNYYVMPSDTFKQLEKLGLLDEVPPHIGFITAHEGRYSKLRLITKKAATKVTPAVDKYMLAWSAVKGRYINSSVSNKKVNSAAIVECKGFKVRERQI